MQSISRKSDILFFFFLEKVGERGFSIKRKINYRNNLRLKNTASLGSLVGENINVAG